MTIYSNFLANVCSILSSVKIYVAGDWVDLQKRSGCESGEKLPPPVIHSG